MNEVKQSINISVIPLRGLTVFPNTMIHFDVKRKQSVEALEEAMKGKQQIFLVAQKELNKEYPNSNDDLFIYGTIAKIKQLVKLPGKIIRVIAEGEIRGKISDVIFQDPYIFSTVEIIDDLKVEINENEAEALLRIAREIIRDFARTNPKFSKDTISKLLNIEDLSKLSDDIASHLILGIENKQKILSEINIIDRLKLVITILNAEVEITSIKNDIQDKVKKKIDKNQKDYYLKEQIKVIQAELGEKQSVEEELEEYIEKTNDLKATEKVKNRLNKEIKRLRKIPIGSSEGAVIRNYIEWLLDMPWDKKTKEEISIEKAEQILDEDHYGLEKVKERVIEHLAVRKLCKNTDSPIICLVGPPGTGKTSIAKSIARSLNRKYSRISLGGVRDEAEIRGHRKTYIGAMPGRIVNALKYAETSNPMILLDEIDKMSSDFKGDPSSALLEVLDGEHNNKFRDHYVELPVDLSDVLFIATANSLRHIPKPLLDRLEIIQVTSYTENEKIHIAKDYLIPKQKAKHGIKEEQLHISQGAISSIINEYTKEAGVRNLERKTGEICRKSAKSILEDDKVVIQISERNIKKYLGTSIYRYDKAASKPQIGIARGLAWTEIGGDTLSIEVNVMNGTGKFELTGQLGDVMKESAKAGISYIRSKADLINNISEDFYEKKDIHIHIPEGAVPKDGPSAGITMATAMISALTNIPVRNDVAMTGEITLRGRVLPIGGLKEKLIAAKRAGISKVLVPEDNKRNILEISKEIVKGLEIVYVNNMSTVIEEALVQEGGVCDIDIV